MPEGSFYGALLRLVVSLAVVFGLLFALRYYLLQRAPAIKAQGLMRVRERVMLGPRSQAVILEVADRSYLVCTTDNAVSVTELSTLPPAELQGDEPPSFAEQLRDALTLFRGRD